MVETLWDKITQFVSPEAGQARSRALNESIGYYIPPEMRGLLGLVADATPSAAYGRAAQASQEMVAPGRTPMQRIGSAGEMLSSTAEIAAPMAVAGRAGMPVAQAVQEGLLGFSAGVDDVGRRFMADESGALTLPGRAGGRVDIEKTGDYDIYRYLIDGKTVGELWKEPGLATVEHVSVLPEFRRKGVGTALYDAAGVKGPSDVLSEDAKAFWASRLAQSTAPAPRNEAEAMARQVLEMRAAGRAGDVTEEMRAAADPQYMFANTPLPMDEASRMARAGNRNAFHGTTSDFPAFDSRAYASSGFGTHMGAADAADSLLRARRSRYAPEDAPIYPEGSQVLPLNVNAGNMLRVSDTGTWGPDETLGAMAWSDDPMAAAAYQRIEKNPDYPRFGSEAERASFVQQALEQEGVGGFVYDNAFEGGGDSYAVFNPANIRSRFALFDPEFAHLRNLSAGVGGLGLLGLGAYDAQQGEQY